MIDKEIVNDSGIFLSEADLVNVGCRNCIFRLNGQCFKGYRYNESGLPEGYCKELADWLFSLAGDTKSSSILWENYNLFVARLQSSEDYREFKNLEHEIMELDRTYTSAEVNFPKDERLDLSLELGDNDRTRLERLEMKKIAAKIWWMRITEMVIKGLGKINDRDSRGENVDKITTVLGLNQLHQFIVDKTHVDLVNDDSILDDTIEQSNLIKVDGDKNE